MSKKNKKKVNSNVEVKENTMNEEMKKEQTAETETKKEGFFKRNLKRIGTGFAMLGAAALGAAAGIKAERSRWEGCDPMEGIEDLPDLTTNVETETSEE